MYNWSVDTRRLKKDPQKYEQFVLEQKINYGLGKEKLSQKALKKYWSKLKIDPEKKAYLKEILWPQS